jgi:phenylacetate-CoA ligase
MKMFSDMSDRPLYRNAYHTAPFTFVSQVAQNELANITAINLLENGDRTARETWQNHQLTNLLRHAHSRSKFWRQRMPSRVINHSVMKYLPIQTRTDVMTQVESEGALVSMNPNAPLSSYASTGSTGSPVKVFVRQENSHYNSLRSLAQYFFNNLSLCENRVQIVPASSISKLNKDRLIVKSDDSWAGPLSTLFCNGSAKKITHAYDDDALIDELLKDSVGYLVCPSRYLVVLVNKGGTELLKRLGITVWQHNSDYRDPQIVETLKSIGVPSLSNYSAGEIGPIAFECSKHEGHFHVAHSNVVIECDSQQTASFNGSELGRLLITHLHSYATPLIRYDIGDFGQLDQKCRCGHDGPVISNIFGRGKYFVRHPNGKLLPFYLSTGLLLEAASFKECRIRQNEIDRITVELGGRETINPDEESKLKKLITRATDPAFQVTIKPVAEIDWSTNPKRLFFISELA